MRAGDQRGREHEVALHAERPGVGAEAVPVERMRPGKETVTDTTTSQRRGPQGADRAR
ncbi:DUF2382 domain-containing protein [Micromonospora sp. WMMD718]|uniref:DUF2382 domain-containing protein n=1 Tax=unclassified Micromonospora TaxID=2617518 RepID=UPI000B20B0E3|nr:MULTISPECIES: DUF2382 domain-containing protein [unclassified Micromonospora]MDG4751595.1 DUF2382 domain-containing protein [Micromonospora sp. WMMD718]